MTAQPSFCIRQIGKNLHMDTRLNIWLPGGNRIPPERRQDIAERVARHEMILTSSEMMREYGPPEVEDRFFLPRNPGRQREFLLQWAIGDRIIRLCNVPIEGKRWVYIFSVRNNETGAERIQCVLVEEKMDASGREYYRLFAAYGSIYHMVRAIASGIWDDPASNIIMVPEFLNALTASARLKIMKEFEFRLEILDMNIQ
jgi:hypothetical protein